jgi:hypothetical protein
LSWAGVVVGACGLMACAAHPVQRVDAPSATDPSAYAPQPYVKPLPPPGYDPAMQPSPPPPPPPPPMTAPAPMPGQ